MALQELLPGDNHARQLTAYNSNAYVINSLVNSRQWPELSPFSLDDSGLDLAKMDLHTQMDPRTKLKWEREVFGIEPRWKEEPAIEMVAKIAYESLGLSHDEISKSTTSFLAQGAFNKLFAVETPRHSAVMRVSLPVDPYFKTTSEVATIELIRARTSIPVPEILAIDSSSENDLGFEWILMERIQGKSIDDKVWISLSWEAKVSLTKHVASIMAQLFGLRSDRIGNVFSACETSSLAEPGRVPLVVGRVVSMDFFMDTHFLLDVPRGPFPSTRERLEVRLQFAEDDCHRALASTETNEEMRLAQDLVARLRQRFDTFFPAVEDEAFVLHHDDISRTNLLLDSNGKLQALIDWECVSTVPLWKACQIPSFLESEKARDVKPMPDSYMQEEDGSPNELYFIHLNDYECTVLRQIFLEEMKDLAPDWVLAHQNSQPKADFSYAVEVVCDFGLGSAKVKLWLDRLDAGGKYESIHDVWNQQFEC